MKKKILLILSVAIAALILPLAAAPFAKVAFSGEIYKKIMSLRNDLGLTDNQKKEIQGVIEKYRDDIKRQIATGKAAREDMREAVLEYGAESNKALYASKGVGDAAASGSLLVAKILTEVKPILTEDQLKKIQQGKADIIAMIEARLIAGSF